jgi:multimeric flavodoxin WrbA
MNIIAICGSPRRGNTEFALRRFLIGAEELGHKTDLVLLREKRIGHCLGCMACDDEDAVCPVKDDMKLIIGKLLANDLIILGSPNYFSNVSGLMKDFIDRLHPAYKDSLLKNKKVVAMVIGASRESASSQNVVNAISVFAQSMKMDMIGDLYMVAREDRDIEESEPSLQKIDEFAKNILS